MNLHNSSSKSWSPPFCPNAKCSYHNPLRRDWPYKRTGYFRRQRAPFRIQRFSCKACGRSFSTQTFSVTYWQKRPDLDQMIFMKTVGGMANRQIARDVGVCSTTIDRHLGRIARHCMLFHWKMLEGAKTPTEIVVDGFESFELSQYYPIHHHVAVEKGTDFFFYFTDSELRRKGRMTAIQKRRRLELEATLGKPDPKAIEKDMRELLSVVLGNYGTATVYSDDHPAYRRSIRPMADKINHLITPGSKHRDQNNQLWEVNLLDLLIRHSSANHKRETIAWSKRRQGSAERLAVLLVWRNYMKSRREKVRGSPTPAMQRGLVGKPLSLGELFKRRLFRGHYALPPRWAEYYEKRVVTRALAKNRLHSLKLAY